MKTQTVRLRIISDRMGSGHQEDPARLICRFGRRLRSVASVGVTMFGGINLFVFAGTQQALKLCVIYRRASFFVAKDVLRMKLLMLLAGLVLICV